jgi:hypothetical protein
VLRELRPVSDAPRTNRKPSLKGSAGAHRVTFSDRIAPLQRRLAPRWMRLRHGADRSREPWTVSGREPQPLPRRSRHDGTEGGRPTFPVHPLLTGTFMRSILLWLIGIPLPIIILLWLFTGHA